MVWYGFFLFLAFDAFNKNEYGTILIACIFCLISYFIDKYLIDNIAEEVIDCGEYLLIKLKKTEDKIYISNIKSISFNCGASPQKVTLSLIKNSAFGKEIIFSPVRPNFDWYNYKKNEIVENLKARISAAQTAQNKLLKHQSQH
jgi:hypothetical protein